MVHSIKRIGEVVWNPFIRYIRGMKILAEFNESHDYDKFIKDVRKFNKDVGLSK
jgi:hypothetical protein